MVHSKAAKYSCAKLFTAQRHEAEGMIEAEGAEVQLRLFSP